MRTLDVIRTERAFRQVWLGQCVSEMGDWFQLIALISLLSTRGSAVNALAGLFIVRWLPTVLLTPVAGVVADRFHRGRVMIAADLLRALVVLSYLFARGVEDLPLIYVLSFLQETLTAFFEPARGAAVPQVVPTHKLYDANALSGATWSTMLAVGAMLGGGAVAAFGIRTAFVLNASSFLLSAVFIMRAHIPPLPRATPAIARTWSNLVGLEDVREGAGYLWTHRPQAAVVGLKAGLGIIGGLSVLISVFAEQVFVADGAPAVLNGWLYAARGVGALIGPFAVQRLIGTSPRGLRRGVLLAFPLAALGCGFFAAAPNAAVGCLAFVFATCFTSTVWVNSTQLLQLTVPNRLLGRVLAVELALLTLHLSASSAAVSLLLSRGLLAPRGAAWALAASMLVPFALWGAANARFGRHLDEAARVRAAG